MPQTKTLNDENTKDPRVEIIRRLFDLNPAELRVVSVIVERIHHGQKLYGALDIDKDPRDWSHEIFEELADALVYAAIEKEKRKVKVIS